MATTRPLLKRRRRRKEGAEAQERYTADETERDAEVLLARPSQRCGHGNSTIKETSGDWVMPRFISTWAGATWNNLSQRWNTATT